MTEPSTGSATGRLAAIDVGTNTIRLTVAETGPDGSYRIVDDEKVTTRLGRGMTLTSLLSPEAMEESVLAIAHLRSIAEGCHVDRLRAVATCAVREARNGEVFVKLVKERAGVPLEVISSEDEGRLAFLSVSRAFDLGAMGVAVVDVGGGSTEIVLSSGNVIERIYPLDIGAVRLTEMFQLGGDDIPEAVYRSMRCEIRDRLRDRIGKPPFVPHLVVGTGGTFTNLASMSMHRGASGGESPALPYGVRGYELQRSDVKHFLHLLRKTPLRERPRIPGLTPRRADIIVAGVAIVDNVLKHLGTNRLRVHDEGIRAGLLQEMVDERNKRSGNDHKSETQDRIHGVRRFAASCHNDDQHADHVAELALSMFDGLAADNGENGSAWASIENRELLHAAALLHDIGYLINYSRHHKHTYHMIMHSPVHGYTHRELMIIANTARYHRGARPKKKHANFSKLVPDDQAIVKHLSAILRLAVGLDRSHAQRIRDISVQCFDDSALFAVSASEDPSVELWGAQRKCRLFESTFGLRPRFCWARATTDAEARDETPLPT